MNFTWISALDVDSHLLLIELLGVSDEGHFNIDAALRGNTAVEGVDSPNAPDTESDILAPLLRVFLYFLLDLLLGILLPAFLVVIVNSLQRLFVLFIRNFYLVSGFLTL